jgi:hypothetical protein
MALTPDLNKMFKMGSIGANNSSKALSEEEKSQAELKQLRLRGVRHYFFNMLGKRISCFGEISRHGHFQLLCADGSIGIVPSLDTALSFEAFVAHFSAELGDEAFDEVSDLFACPATYKQTKDGGCVMLSPEETSAMKATPFEVMYSVFIDSLKFPERTIMNAKGHPVIYCGAERETADHFVFACHENFGKTGYFGHRAGGTYNRGQVKSVGAHQFDTPMTFEQVAKEIHEDPDIEFVVGMLAHPDAVIDEEG